MCGWSRIQTFAANKIPFPSAKSKRKFFCKNIEKMRHWSILQYMYSKPPTSPVSPFCGPIRALFLFLALAWPLSLPAQAPQGTGQATLTTLEEVMERYKEANGGKENLEFVNSLRVFGTMEEDGIIYDIVMVKKRPNRKRIALRHLQNSLVMGFDGQRSWRAFEHHGMLVGFELLEGIEAMRFEQDVEFDGPLLSGSRDGQEVRLARTERIGRVEFYVAEIVRPDERTEVFIDARNFREHKTVLFRNDEEGNPVRIESRLSNYQQVGGIWVAMLVERFVDGNLTTRIRLDRAEVNPGIFDSFFEMPSAPEGS